MRYMSLNSHVPQFSAHAFCIALGSKFRMADANDQTQAMPSQGEDDNRCDICLMDLSVGESEYLPCSHKFHLECLLDWAKH